MDKWSYSSSASKMDISQIGSLDFKPMIHKNRLAELAPQNAGYVYLKADFTLEENLLGKPLSLFAGRIIWADEVYVNGHRIGSTGSGPPRASNHWNIPRLYPIPDMFLNGKRNNQIVMMVYVDTEGALSDIPVIGPSVEMEKQNRLHRFLNVEINVILTFFLLFISIYHFLIYWYRKKDVSNLYYSLLLVSFGLYNANMFIWAAVKKVPHSRQMFIGVVFLLGGSVHDILLVVFNLNSGIYIAGWGLFPDNPPLKSPEQ